MDYAISQGFVPYMDYRNFYKGRTRVRENVWERYFTQPDGVSKNEVYTSRNVIVLGYRKEQLDTPDFPDRILNREDNRRIYDKLLQRFSIKPDMQKRIDKEAQELDIGNCIGVFLRGTDFSALRPAGHHIQPTVQELNERLDKFAASHENSGIFLVTEDGAIYRQIKERFPQCKVASFDSFVDNYSGEKYLVYEKKSEGNSDDEYFIKMMLLAKCRYFVGSSASGSNVARMFNGGQYKDEEVIDYGNY